MEKRGRGWPRDASFAMIRAEIAMVVFFFAGHAFAFDADEALRAKFWPGPEEEGGRWG